MENWELLLFFFAIALLYASVGFGGGSSYLAMLAWYEFPVAQVRLTSLLCNIVVVSGGTYTFHRHGHLNLRKSWPIVAFSVPAAFAGGALRLTEEVFFTLLGISLIIAALAMWWQASALARKVDENSSTAYRPWHNAVLGGGIGFLSGLLGIGGGIFLAPMLHLLRWDNPKTIAATASFYILVNSISGILGQLTGPQSNINWTYTVFLMGAVFFGGLLGSQMGAVWWKASTVKKVTAVLVAYIGFQILF